MRGCALLLLALSPACSVLRPTYTAEQPGTSGRAPVEVAVDIEGNTSVSSVDLGKRIEDYMLDLSRDPTRESAIYDAGLEVEDYYRTLGYPVAKVAYEYSPPGEEEPWPATVRALFTVQEGPLVTVSMMLAGNAAYDTDELLELWSRKRSGTFGLGGPVFVEARVRSFVEDLRVFYRRHARLDAVVGEPQIEVDLEQGRAQVRIEIQEGHVHTIRAVEIAEALREALGADLPAAQEGRPYAEGEMHAYRHDLRSALRKKGYPNPRIDLAAAPIEGSPFEVRLSVDGDPGPLATVATLGVSGNDKTLDGVILGKVGITPGDRYDGEKVDEALRGLYMTGLFRKVDVQEVPVDGDMSRLGLAVAVEENESRSIEVLGGYGSYEQLRGGLRLEERNLFGTGRGIAFDSRVSMKGYATGVTLTDPDFLSTRSTLTVSSEYFRREEPSFTDEALGSTVALARTLTAKLTARVGYTYRDRTDARAFTALPQDQLVDFVEGKVFVELRNDHRDNLLFPRAGHAEFLSFERIAPEFGANVDLDRLTFRATKHFALWEPLHLVLRTEQNVLWPHDGSARVPLQERWFNGGEGTVRSYREAQLGPKDDLGRPVGGEYRNILGAELRFPIWEALEGGLFADAGNVGSRVADFSLDDLGYGLGAGLRLLLPIGPVRLDAAWNPDRQPGDDAWALHLSVGYAF